MNSILAILSLLALILIGIWMANTPPWYASSSEHRKHKENEEFIDTFAKLAFYIFAAVILISILRKI